MLDNLQRLILNMEKLHSLHSIPSPTSHLCGLAWVDGCLWYSDGNESTLYKLDPENGETLTVYRIPDVNASLSYDGGYLWQVTGEGYLTGPKSVTKIDPESGVVLEVVGLGEDSVYVAGVEVCGDKVWVGLEQRGRLQQRRLYTCEILRDYEAEPRIAGITAADGSFFYCEFDQRLLVEVDPEKGGELARYRLDGNPTGLTWDGDYVWYNDYTGKKIRKVKPPR
jgi:glutamine cyclotransferase